MDPSNKNSLLEAAKAGDIETIIELNKLNKDLITQKTNDGCNALQMAAMNGHIRYASVNLKNDENFMSNAASKIGVHLSMLQ